MSGTCLICGSATRPYFSKQYARTTYWEPLLVEYARCTECGFVSSSTHREMDDAAWEALNTSCHVAFEGETGERTINQPPYAEMALALCLLARNSVLRTDRVLDYAAGYGTLSKVLAKYFGIGIDCFDAYVTDTSGSVRYVTEADLAGYPLVINSAMFEHVRTRRDLDAVNDAVSGDGVLMLHTLVCENVPADPDWFYLAPIVHSAFHTNRSMGLLMDQWGYACSAYAPAAKSWFLFKRDSPVVETLPGRLDAINDELQCRFFHHARGFVDYWKGF